MAKKNSTAETLPARVRSIRPDAAHLWAHGALPKSQSEPEGYAATNSARNFYARGDTIYSYGSHFPISRRVPRKGGGVLFLFTTRGYSVTTAGHISEVRRSIPHGALVIDANPKHWGDLIARNGSGLAADLAADVARELESMRKPGIRGGTRLGHWNAAGSIVFKWESIRAALNLRNSAAAVRIPAKAIPDDATLADWRDAAALAETRKQNRRIENDARYRAQNERREQISAAERTAAAAHIPQWRAGASSEFVYSVDGKELGGSIRSRGTFHLRIDPRDPSRVETNYLAFVPLDDARRLFEALPKLIGRGPVDISCGPFQGIEATPNALRVGCHKFTMAEICDFADSQGWTIPDALKYARVFYYESQGNGLTVTIYHPDGRSAFLQGDDAAAFLERAQGSEFGTTAMADLCREYAPIFGGAQ